MEPHYFEKEPILVYCHLKPVAVNTSKVCLSAKDDHTIMLNTGGNKNAKDEFYSFTHIFDSNATQKTLFDHVALPLIKDLLRGRNGVLFMHGVLFNEEILVRCIDVIFNSIRNHQTSKSVLKSCLTEADSMQEIGSKRTINKSVWRSQIQDSSTIEICSHKNYYVLVSNVEIYKNYIYDLLENSAIKQKLPKTLLEGPDDCVYVSEAIEKEVASAEEALCEFEKGQIHRTNLLAILHPKSRCCSQTVFIIKVVHTRSNLKAENISKKEKKVSQLSIVYLHGDKDVFQNRILCPNFGHINKNVIALQKCFDAHREILNRSTKKVIPYEESKLTQLFQSYFKGEGKIRMLISISPDEENYENVLEALKFAERSQDISSVSFSSFTLSEESKFSDQFHVSGTKCKNKWGCSTPVSKATVHAVDISHSSKNWIEDELHIDSLVNSLNIKILQHRKLARSLMNSQENFRKNLINVEKENIHLKQENVVLQQDLKCRESQAQHLKQKLLLAEQTIDNLNGQNLAYQQQVKKVKEELDLKTKRLIEQSNEIEEVKQKIHEKLVREKGKLKKIMDKRFAAKQAELKRRLCFTDEKIKQLREILNADELDILENINLSSTPSIISSGSWISTSIQMTNSITDQNLMKLQSALELPQERKNLIESINFNNCYSTKGCETSMSSEMYSTQEELLDKSPYLCTDSISCFSRKEKQSSTLELREKPLSTYTKSTVNSSKKQRNTAVKELDINSNFSVGRSRLHDAFMAKEKNNSVFSIKKENLSNQGSVNETEVKQLSSIPFIYRMRSEIPKQSRITKVVIKPFKFCTKGVVIQRFSRKNHGSKDLWLEHKPVGNLELNPALEPKVKKRKSVWTLRSKDVINNTVSKYILQHQESDSCGEIETQIYKGDILPSVSGGAQVIFTELEKICPVPTLNNNSLRKRSGERLPLNEVEKRCKISLECHGHQVKRH